MADTISQVAINLIVSAEITDQATYEKLYQHPTWPGGSSGVTIGIGYDLGYVTADECRADWSNQLSAAMIDAMVTKAVGLKADIAKVATIELKSQIIVPWSAAMAVFENHDIPKWIKRVQAALPNTDQLSPDCLGALVSLAYNRGADFTSAGDRRREMRNIKQWMTEKDFDRIPAELLSMRRLWPDMKGLRDRREAEANLFLQGLS